MTKWELSQDSKVDSTYNTCKQKKRQNHMIISVDEETAFNKILHFFHGKNTLQARNRMGIPQPGKGHLGKTKT